MRASLLSLALVGCGPVLLGEERAGPRDSGSSELDADVDAGELSALVTVGAADCRGCFNLVAEAVGGVAPFTFEWDDGSRNELRRVCVDRSALLVSVVAEDARAVRSTRHTTRLEVADAGCPLPAPALPLLCLENPSFEGVAAGNLGLPNTFNAAHWDVCTNPSAGNTPDIVNDSLQMIVPLPPPTDGLTYLSLGESEQVSQALCKPLRNGEVRNLRLDLSRIDVNGNGPDTEPVLLEIWGGLAADCVREERLWASPALEIGWQTHCVTLQPRNYIDNLFLRAKSNETQTSPAYLIVDHLVPVEKCP